ncbi:MAG: DUF5698 domain-containing protein [Ignavibacteriales bacterium]|nr:DUF5698 domain-containing protein [Ignavibacteriales bacterium]MCF8314575.1 DUF5698 domain-containing protein [Ignavibacteriales bacterium]MCF8436388.1 DUF5698 domain-containing protein [Ignavibacteriales bacterium]
MLETLLGALFIMVLRIFDVTIGTFRTILVVQAKRYHAAIVGFFEVLIWITAMKYIVGHMDEWMNLLGYAAGFAIGNLLGITLEEKVALGFVQLNVISRDFSETIARKLRESQFGVTVINGEGIKGEVDVLICIIKRRELKNAIRLIDSIDSNAFVTVQHSRPYRGFVHGSRK